jgi:hypothetical protein
MPDSSDHCHSRSGTFCSSAGPLAVEIEMGMEGKGERGLEKESRHLGQLFI